MRSESNFRSPVSVGFRTLKVLFLTETDAQDSILVSCFKQDTKIESCFETGLYVSVLFEKQDLQGPVSDRNRRTGLYFSVLFETGH
jgi:hypothetical protein